MSHLSNRHDETDAALTKKDNNNCQEQKHPDTIQAKETKHQDDELRKMIAASGKTQESKMPM